MNIHCLSVLCVYIGNGSRIFRLQLIQSTKTELNPMIQCPTKELIGDPLASRQTHQPLVKVTLTS